MIDLYCERLGPGLWAEPLNASTNLVFLLAAWGSWRLARRSGIRAASVLLLISLIASIGIGSALFHTFATLWARVLDVAPILFFKVCFFWLYSRRVVRARAFYAAPAVGGFLLATFLGRYFSGALNGSLGYAPALVVLIGLGLYHYEEHKREHLVMLAASGVFVLALFFRTIDLTVCPNIPFGTHFLWHICVAVAAYLAMRGLVLNWHGEISEPR